MSRLTKGYIIELIGITFWSTTSIFIRILTGTYQMPPLLLAFWRNILVCLALVLALSVLRPALLRMQKKDLSFFLFFGLALGFMNATWVLSVKFNGAAVATVLVYGSASFTALVGHWVFKEGLGLPKIAVILLSFAGCVLVAEAYSPAVWGVNPLGISIGLFSGLTFALYSLMGKQAAKRGINPWNSMFLSFLIGSFFLLAFNFFPIISGSIPPVTALLPSLPFKGWLILIVLSFVPTLLGNGLYITSMVYLPVSVANLVATLEPAMTAVEAYLFLGERLTAFQIIGSFLVVTAVVMIHMFEGGPGQVVGEVEEVIDTQ
jgi:DME family drug/metabolite transporter